MHAVVLAELCDEEYKDLITPKVHVSNITHTEITWAVDADMKTRLANIVDYLLEPFCENDENYFTEGYEEACFCNEDPECGDCSGTGIFSRRYNPEGIYDWYEIGGRWAGAAYGVNIPSKELAGYQIAKVKHINRFRDTGLGHAINYVVTKDRNLIRDANEWLTAPENADKYMVVIDYHC